ncbi:MAG: class I SAM-dependent methyltransferase [Casimicrobium sp.]
MTLTFTGERFLTECQGEMVYEHWHRYLLAREYAKGKRVLDIPSGEGYGSHLLASVAESVVGIDIAPDAVAHASEKYRRDNLSYLAASGTKIPLPDASFDFIVSFEMIEHIHEQKEFLAEVNRLLKPNGVFLISSPNRVEYTEKTGYKNEFHVKELDQQELRDELLVHWPNQIWLGQRLSFNSLMWPINTAAQRNWAMDVGGGLGFPEAMYFLVFCAKQSAALTQIDAPLTFVTDKENSVYNAWTKTYRDNVAIHAENQRLHKLLEERNVSTIETQHTSPEPWLVRLARKIAS